MEELLAPVGTTTQPGPADRRREIRTLVDLHFNVEFLFGDEPVIYHYRILNTSPRGVGIVVQKGSPVLEHLKPGAQTKVRFSSPALPQPGCFMDAEIRHVSPVPEGEAEDLVVVGLRILSESYSQ